MIPPGETWELEANHVDLKHVGYTLYTDGMALASGCSNLGSGDGAASSLNNNDDINANHSHSYSHSHSHRQRPVVVAVQATVTVAVMATLKKEQKRNPKSTTTVNLIIM
mmetsp:Transcript_13913/g.25132  ORF Transcript_13913/g.25132 Transcript_13913/m.25132 type:complete len:109 (+) Transcript_13913:83-409(+)